jgi:thioesterase domain-containing protein
VHDVGGGNGGFAGLSQALGEEQPFYGLRSRGRDGLYPPHTTIESMAADYLELVRQVQPSGPYALGGYCCGGMVSYEMARQLREAGEEIAALVAIEAYAPMRVMQYNRLWSPGRWPHYLRNFPGWVADHVSLGPRYTWNRLTHVLGQWSKQVGQRLGIRKTLRAADFVAGGDTLPDHRQAVVLAHLAAIRVYLPPAADVAMTLINIRRQSMLRDPDRRRGWHRLARRGLTLKIVSGSHHTVLTPPHLQAVARALADALDGA